MEHKSEYMKIGSFATRKEADAFIDKSIELARKKGIHDARFSIQDASEEEKALGFTKSVFVFKSPAPVDYKKLQKYRQSRKSLQRDKNAVPKVIAAGYGGIEIQPGRYFKTAIVTCDESAYERYGENADSNVKSALSAETKGAKWEVRFIGTKKKPKWEATRISSIPRKKK